MVYNEVEMNNPIGIVNVFSDYFESVYDIPDTEGGGWSKN